MELVTHIQKYWQLYSALVAIILGYSALGNNQRAMETRVGNLETELREMRNEFKTTQAAQSDVKAQLSQIQTDLLWIRKSLEKEYGR